MDRLRATGLTLLLLAMGACAPTSTSVTPAPSANDISATTIGAAAATTVPSTSTTHSPEPSAAPLDAVFQIVGTSAGGRPLVVTEFGDGPHRVFVIGGIHGDERTGVDTSLALVEHLRHSLPDGVTVRWFVDANPDGSAAVHRDNANGVDINRNWPTGHSPGVHHGFEPLSEPEARALDAQIEQLDPHVIVAMHSAREGPFVNYDGPGVELAAAFASGATGRRTWEVVPTVDWPTPGSIGSHFGRELGLPVITVEGNRWDDPAAILPELERGFDAMLNAITRGTAPAAPICADHSIGNSCTDLTRRVNRVLFDRVRGTSGYMLKEAGGLVHAARWVDHPIHPASTIEVLHLTHLLLEARDEPSKLLDRSIPYDPSCDATGPEGRARLGELVEAMLIDSDNQAANAIQRWLGLDALARTATALGMRDTRVVHGFGCRGPANRPANTTTIADLTTLYDGIAAGETLDAKTRAVFLDSLLDITDVIADELDVDAPPGVRVVAKSGRDGADLSIAGIAETPGGTFVFGAYTSGPRSLGSEFEIERIVAELLREHFATPET